MADGEASAVEPEPEKPVEKTWEVVGPTSFLGHAPGETFTRALPPDQERRAVARGSIKESKAKADGAESKGATPESNTKPGAQKPPANAKSKKE